MGSLKKSHLAVKFQHTFKVITRGIIIISSFLHLSLPVPAVFGILSDSIIHRLFAQPYCIKEHHLQRRPLPATPPSCLWMQVGILKWVEFITKHSSWSCWLMPTCGERSREAQISRIKQRYVTGNPPEGNISFASPPGDAHGETMWWRVCVCMSGRMDVKVGK